MSFTLQSPSLRKHEDFLNDLISKKKFCPVLCLCLIAHHLTAGMKLLPTSTAWYLKTEATFSDVLALVRRAI